MTTSMSADSPRHAIDATQRLGLAEMGRGLGHRWRISILTALLEAPNELSTTDLADQLDTTISRLDHHVKYLLALGMIESTRSRQVKGTRQHFYLLVPAVRMLFIEIARHPLPTSIDANAASTPTLTPDQT
jgi:DNA-binding transcriptional ArsR family regulator